MLSQCPKANINLLSYWEGKALKKSEGVKIRTSLLTVGPRVIQSTRMQAMILLTMGCKKKNDPASKINAA